MCNFVWSKGLRKQTFGQTKTFQYSNYKKDLCTMSVCVKVTVFFFLFRSFETESEESRYAIFTSERSTECKNPTFQSHFDVWRAVIKAFLRSYCAGWEMTTMWCISLSALFFNTVIRNRTRLWVILFSPSLSISDLFSTNTAVNWHISQHFSSWGIPICCLSPTVRLSFSFRFFLRGRRMHVHSFSSLEVTDYIKTILNI